MKASLRARELQLVLLRVWLLEPVPVPLLQVLVLVQVVVVLQQQQQLLLEVQMYRRTRRESSASSAPRTLEASAARQTIAERPRALEQSR